MALIKCPECRKPISDKAVRCPACGFQMKQMGESNHRVMDPKRKKLIIRSILGVLAIAAAVSIAVLAKDVVIPSLKYKRANDLMDDKQYESAIQSFQGLNGYKESGEKLKKCQYLNAKQKAENGEYQNAIEILNGLDDYLDSSELINEYKDAIIYDNAVGLLGEGKYEDAIDMFKKVRYKDSQEQVQLAYEGLGDSAFEKKDYHSAIRSYEEGGIISDNYYQSCYKVASDYMKDGNYSDAMTYFNKCLQYSDAKEKYAKCIDLKEKRTGFFYKKIHGGYYMVSIEYNMTDELMVFAGYNSSETPLRSAYSQRFSYRESLGTEKLKSIGGGKYTFEDLTGYKIKMKYKGDGITVLSGTIQGMDNSTGYFKRY